MPNGEFERQLAEWEKEAKRHWDLATTSQKQLSGQIKRLEEIQEPPEWVPSWLRWVPNIGYARIGPWSRRGLVAKLKPQIDVTQATLERDDFYYRLYSEVPFVLSSGQMTSVDEVLTKLTIPTDLRAEELSDIRDTIANMIGIVTARLPEMALEAEVPELPELIPPTAVPRPIPVGIQAITVAEIIKALAAPTIPPSVMSEAEWLELLKMEGYSDADLEQVTHMEDESQRIIAEWEERSNRLDAFRENLAEMPDYKLTDWLKELVVQPGLALMEMAGLYFEHVTMPLAGHAYRKFIPDIETEYQRLIKTESTWRAAQMAWENWDQNFFLKYILMEGFVDPFTYFGWGIATRITRPIPYVGRLVGAAERGIQTFFEIPFDMIKAGWKAIPKTTAQRALIAQHQAGQYVEQYMTKFLAKPLNQITMKGWDDAAKAAFKFLKANPMSEELPARAARELLKHPPVDEKLVMNWGARLGTTLRPEDITRVTVENIENIFEDAFARRIITTKEAAGRLLRILDVGDMTDDVLKLAQRLIEGRGDQILNAALRFGRAKSPYQAMSALMRRNYRIHIATEESVAYLARKETGALSALLAKTEIRVQAVWRDVLDKWVVRPFAEAYLTFGMYGPMNMLEDVIRSTLGGVTPGRLTIKGFERKWVGIGYDPNLKRDAISEMIGYFRARPTGELNNWILQLGGLAKGFGDRTYQILVEAPGHIGMQVRRHYLDRRATQILVEKGGDKVRRLANVGPRKLTGVTDKKIIKEVEQAAVDGKLSGNPDYIRGMKDEFTRKPVIRREVDDILMEHPNLPRTTRDFIMKEYDGDVLFREAGDSIETTMREANSILMDDFIRGAEHATKQMEQLADLLIEMEVKNPQEMARCIQAVNKMAEVYGATPRQIMAQATIRNRGLPLLERRASFDKAFDDIYLFMDKAGASIDRVVERLKLKMAGAGVTDEYVTMSERLFDIMATKREYVTEFRAQNMATRHEVFTGATQAELRTATFWDDFYLQMDAEYHIHNVRMAELDGMMAQAIESLDMAAGVKPFVRPAIKVTDRALSPQDVASLIGARGDDVSRALLDVLTSQNDRDMFVAYVMAKVRTGDVGFTKEAVGSVYDQIAYSLRVKPEAMSWITGKQMELDAVRHDLHHLYNSKLLPDDEVAAIGKFLDETANAVDELMYTTIPGRGRRPPTKVLTEQFKDYDALRQSSMDEAHKWYYKEYVDYTNANVFDATMKTIYPYWTYESQRLFWLPRSFLRHPGTFTAFERWQNNTDYGYIHIPGTSADINPFRGTIYGTLTTRLARRDYPEYYDALGVAKYPVEFNDFLTRYGFYPGAHIGIPLAMFGGLEQQMGETMPAIWKTPLNALIAAFPESESVKYISDNIFSDRFRDYMTILEVNRRGYDGVAIWTKLKEKLELTEEEQTAWDSARGEAALYGVGFEQMGLFRLRTEEQYRVYEEASKVIEEMTGYTPEQQDWLRRHGYRIWDLVGGMSPTNQAILQEMDYYRWVGLIRPLLPSRQQIELNRLELDWDDVRRYSEGLQNKRLELQRDFLVGRVGPEDYNDGLIGLYDDNRKYIDRKMEENPLMTLEGRKEYYKKYGVIEPVRHPMYELLNLYFSVELVDIIDPETGEKIKDWDTFWALREAIDNAIPDHLKSEWEDYLARNTTRIEAVRREIYKTYLKPYNRIWEQVLISYPEDEQKLIEEYLYLERTGRKLERQVEIKAMVSAKTGNLLISSFRSDVSGARVALRYANPALDAWLFYWGRTTTFQTPGAEDVYRQIAKDTGRQID